jgi:hypothetical protein
MKSAGTGPTMNPKDITQKAINEGRRKKNREISRLK